MAEEIINTFSDADCERIIRSVRKSEGIPTPPSGRTRTPQVNEYPIVHFQNGATAIAAFNETTKQMSSRTCRIWESNSTGGLVDTGVDLPVYNPGGEIAANKWGVAQWNQAGILVAIVVRC